MNTETLLTQATNAPPPGMLSANVLPPTEMPMPGGVSTGAGMPLPGGASSPANAFPTAGMSPLANAPPAASFPAASEETSPLADAPITAPTGILAQADTSSAAGAETPFAAPTNADDPFSESPVEYVRRLVYQVIDERRTRFMQDPAGVAQKNPLFERGWMGMVSRGLPGKVSREDQISWSMQLQKERCEEVGLPPRALTRAEAAEYKDAYFDRQGARQKADLLSELSTQSGKYATKALLETGIAPGLGAFGRLLSQLPKSDIAKMVQGCEQGAEALGLPQERLDRIKTRVAQSNIMQGLTLAAKALAANASAADPAGSTAPDAASANSAPAASFSWDNAFAEDFTDDVKRTLEGYVAQGGSLQYLERVISLETLGEMRRHDISTGPTREAAEAARTLGLTARVAVNGASRAADFVATPARLGFNIINGLLGGDWDYFKPISSSLSDAARLPMPETDAEKYWSAMGEGGVEAAFLVWGGAALMAGKAANAAPTFMQNLGRFFAEQPAAQIAGGAAGNTAALAAQMAGTGPWGQLGAAVLGGGSTGSIVSGVAGGARTGAEAAAGAVEAGAHALDGGAGAAGKTGAESAAAAVGGAAGGEPSFIRFRPAQDMREAELQARELGVKAEYWDRGRGAEAAPEPGSLETARLINDCMAAVKTQGLPIPSKVVYDETVFREAENAVAAYISGSNTLVLRPGTTVEGLAKDAIEQNSIKFWSTASPNHAINHELGHAMHAEISLYNFSWLSGKEFTAPLQAIIRREVSRYAAENPREFVAEVFAGLMSGTTYGQRIMRLYSHYGGR